MPRLATVQAENNLVISAPWAIPGRAELAEAERRPNALTPLLRCICTTLAEICDRVAPPPRHDLKPARVPARLAARFCDRRSNQMRC